MMTINDDANDDDDEYKYNKNHEYDSNYDYSEDDDDDNDEDNDKGLFTNVVQKLEGPDHTPSSTKNFIFFLHPLHHKQLGLCKSKKSDKVSFVATMFNKVYISF